MTAATITLAPGEAAVINDARAALARVDADDFPWPDDSGLLRMYRDGLREALDDHARLTGGGHPADLFEDLGRHQDNAMETALERVTDDIRMWTGELTRLANEAEDTWAAQETARAREEGDEAA